ncbi:MAG: isoprenylcysteine carboxylmethyltransferase family protein [Pseudomonadota bacterium]
MKLLVPPPLICVLAIVLTYASKLLFPATRVDLPLLPNIGLAIAALGLLLALIAVPGFVSRKTTVNPHKPEKTSALVTDGVYAFTRNPMYLALVLIAAGAALMQAAPLGLAFALLAGWYITEFQIKPEEAALRDIFGDEFETYSKRVRRWI